MWITTFKVSGCGCFPLDMLRYDGCYPRSSDDVCNMHVDRTSPLAREVSTVELVMMGATREEAQPTLGRWASFGFPVVAGSISTLRRGR